MRSALGPFILLAGLTAVVATGAGLALMSLLTGTAGLPPSSCGGSAVTGAGAGIVVTPGGAGQVVGATEYGGPGDPSSRTVGASGLSLLRFPDSYAELGGDTFQTAADLGGLPYLTPLRITWGGHSAVAYKRDIGLGGGPVAGHPRVIDLWWRFAAALGIPYERGLWSGAVRIARPPATGAGAVLAQDAPGAAAGAVLAQDAPGAAAGAVLAQDAPGAAAGALLAQDAPGAAAAVPAAEPSPASACSPVGVVAVPLTSGERARLLPSGLAAAPAGAPAAVRGMIAAGDQIAGRPYVYGAAHGLPLDEIAPAYDCSSSVEHLLYGGGLLPVGYGAASGALESFGAPGPGRWVTIYASADHVFMYVAGLRWDTWNAAGPQDGSTGIGWHPLVRAATGFVARHPVGL